MTRLHVLARGREGQGEAVSGVVVYVVTGIWLTGTKKAKRRRGGAGGGGAAALGQ